MEESVIPKRVLYVNLEKPKPRGVPRNIWQVEVREDGRIVGGEEWQEKVYKASFTRRFVYAIPVDDSCVQHS
jgi:hypothetical protein